MNAGYGWKVAVAIALAVGVNATGSRVTEGDAEAPPAFTHWSQEGGHSSVLRRTAAGAECHRADTLPIRFHPRDNAIRLDIGIFGPCVRDFDAHTRVASIYCPKVGSPEEREFLFINVYLSRTWADSADAESVARIIRDNGQPGFITEYAFAAPARQSDAALSYFLTQTHVAPDNTHGNAYLATVSQAPDAVVAVLYGQRFDAPTKDLRARARQWLTDNLAAHFAQISRISLDPAWFGALRSMAR